ncbi:uncharacterized protein [Palaemon carinicauda]|uniref:uncharacterized protein n=1 Tax=Palaemon carinicauda TaxID=392227 RepID=UPI0035B5F666
MSINLKDAYFQIPVHPSSRKYLRVKWGTQTLQFKTLCFGLSTDPQVFTRIFATVSAWAHEQGTRLIRYLDDWLLLSDSREVLRGQGAKLLQFCNVLGITINLEKSQLIPSTRMTYLGMVLDWQRLIGHLESLEKLVPLGRLNLRGVQWNLKEAWNQRDSPHKVVPVTKETKVVLEWWIDTSNTLKGTPFADDPPEMLLFTDASKEGWGAHLLDSTARGRWGPEEKNLHINVLEMMAVKRACLEFVQKLRGNTVALMSDNATVVVYVKKQGGLKSKELCSFTLEFLE